MAYTKLTDAQCREAVAEYEAAGHNASQAAMTLGLSHGSMQNRLRVAKQRGIVPAPPPARESLHAGRRLPQTADECWALLDDFIGRSARPETSAKSRAVRKHARRVVIAGDLHAPFQDSAAVAELLRREQGADLLIVNGDLQDFYAVSRYIKYERVSIEAELAAVDALLGQLSRSFTEVTVVAGNHDHQRFEKQLRERLSPEMMHVVEYLTGGNLSVIRLIAQRYPNIRLTGTPVGRHTLQWFHQEGDLLCTHAETFSSVEGSVLRRMAVRMERMSPVFGLAPWTVCVQAHTHQFGILKVGDKLMIEGGCMADIPGYALTASSGASVQTTGYVTLTQQDGRTDWNSVRFIHLRDRDRALNGA